MDNEADGGPLFSVAVDGQTGLVVLGPVHGATSAGRHRTLTACSALGFGFTK